VDIFALPETMRFSIDHKACLNRSLAAVEKEHIQNVLASVGGSKTQAAKTLTIDRNTLREKLKKVAADNKWCVSPHRDRFPHRPPFKKKFRGATCNHYVLKFY
jgi:hypothetical protein